MEKTKYFSFNFQLNLILFFRALFVCYLCAFCFSFSLSIGVPPVNNALLVQMPQAEDDFARIESKKYLLVIRFF